MLLRTTDNHLHGVTCKQTTTALRVFTADNFKSDTFSTRRTGLREGQGQQAGVHCKRGFKLVLRMKYFEDKMRLDMQRNADGGEQEMHNRILVRKLEGKRPLASPVLHERIILKRV
jgi:hypothetical protein